MLIWLPTLSVRCFVCAPIWPSGSLVEKQASEASVCVCCAFISPTVELVVGATNNRLNIILKRNEHKTRQNLSARLMIIANYTHSTQHTQFTNLVFSRQNTRLELYRATRVSTSICELSTLLLSRAHKTPTFVCSPPEQTERENEKEASGATIK